MVDGGASTDFTLARNLLNSIKTMYDNSEQYYYSAESRLDYIISTANNDPDPEADYTDEIESAMANLESKKEIYEYLKQAYHEAEALTNRIKMQTDTVREQVQNTRNRLTQIGDTAVSSIKKAEDKISKYVK
jgi:hypothetical protein